MVISDGAQKISKPVNHPTQDEEIPIENDKCVMDFGTFPDVGGDWTFTFDFKINSLPAEPTDPKWWFYVLSVLMDYRSGRVGPSRLMDFEYIQNEKYPNSISISNTRGGISQSGHMFEVNQWYKFTTTGSRDGDKCKQRYVIEGPGLTSYYGDGKWVNSATNECLVLEDGYPLKVFSTIDLSRGYGDRTSLDGVLRNVAFTNTATDETMNTIC